MDLKAKKIIKDFLLPNVKGYNEEVCLNLYLYTNNAEQTCSVASCKRKVLAVMW